MKAFKGLLWKDFMISKVWFFGLVAIVLLIYLLGFSISKYFNDPFITIIFVIVLAFWHLAVIPIILYSMLRVEGKTQLWLHSTQSSYKLLLSKFIIAFMYSTISLLIVDALGVLSLSFQTESFNVWPWREGIFVNLAITISELSMGIWVVFYWAIYHYLGKFSKIKGIRWLILVIFFICYQFLGSLITQTKWFINLMDTWTVQYGSKFQFRFDSSGGEFDLNQAAIPIPVSSLLLHIVMMIGIFFLASWVIDRKVEV